MMEKLNLGQNNEGLFNPVSNSGLNMNQMRGPMDQMKQWGDEEDSSTFSLNNALNQLSSNQSNSQFGGNLGNLTISDNLGNIMNTGNEGQNK